MPEKSQVVETFQQIKSEANCDDLSAAILTLAQSLDFNTVTVQVSDHGYPERVGESIAKAIESLRREPPSAKKRTRK